MADTKKAITALAGNEPIDWLLGRVLRAGIARGESHFIVEALAGKNPHAVQAWNAWIAEFRSLLRNPDEAPKKADAELIASPLTRIEDFITEIFAVLYLSRNGYTDFEIVLAGNNMKAVDFVASRAGKRVRIEVKNLREPEDIVRTVAGERWKRCRAEHPNKFNFSVLLSHSHSGPLTDAAISGLKNVIDQIPEFASSDRQIVLDGNVQITIRRLNEEKVGAEDVMIEHMTDRGRESRLIVQSPIKAADLEFSLPDLQRLFVKAFATVGDAVFKFFGRQSDSESENVIVLRWQAPEFFYDEDTPQIVKQAIEGAFTSVSLQMTVFVLGSDPEPNFKLKV
jgi:hypothetical protein